MDFTTSQKRQVLPGMKYELPPPQDKLDPRTESREHFLSLCRAEGLFDGGTLRADKFITAHYLGISSLLAKEIAHRASDSCERIFDVMSGIFKVLDAVYISRHLSAMRIKSRSNTVLRMWVFTKIRHLLSIRTEYPLYLNCFSANGTGAERIRQRESDILRMLGNADARLHRKLALSTGSLPAVQREGSLNTSEI